MRNMFIGYEYNVQDIFKFNNTESTKITTENISTIESNSPNKKTKKISNNIKDDNKENQNQNDTNIKIIGQENKNDSKISMIPIKKKLKLEPLSMNQ